MAASSAVVVVIDRLGAGWLGPYGNTWLETPHFNRLAAQSLVCETVLADSPDLATAYSAYWSGRHAMQPDGPGAAGLLPELAAAAGAKSVLVTDDAAVAEHSLAASFAERRLIKPHEVRTSAGDLEQTGLFLLFGEALAVLAHEERPSLVWIHARAMSGPWDAPYELRSRFADEEDPQPPTFVQPPERRLEPGFDPDEVLGLVHAYAGQVALADLALGMLLEAMNEQPLGQSTLLAVTSPRGYPLGEHQRVGPCDEALYAELLQVPLIVRLPQRTPGIFGGWRTQQVVQPAELYSVVAESCGWEPGAESPGSRLLREMAGDSTAGPSVACAIGLEQRAIRTPAWFLRQSRISPSTPAAVSSRGASSSGDQAHHELFAKPDDRWEANEVSSRCSDIVELLAAQLDQFEQAAAADQLAALPPLAEALCEVWR